MTWTTAKHDAEQLLPTILAQLDKLAQTTTVRIGVYDTQDALDLLQPTNTWPVAHHRMVMGAAARLIERRGFKVKLVPITLAAYQDWLGHRENTPQMRAAFVTKATQ